MTKGLPPRVRRPRHCRSNSRATTRPRCARPAMLRRNPPRQHAGQLVESHGHCCASWSRCLLYLRPPNPASPKRPVSPADSRRKFPGDCLPEQRPVRWVRRDESPTRSAVRPRSRRPPQPCSAEGPPLVRYRPAESPCPAPSANAVPSASAVEPARPLHSGQCSSAQPVLSSTALTPGAAQRHPISSLLALHDPAQIAHRARARPPASRARRSGSITRVASHPAEPPEQWRPWQRCWARERRGRA